MSFKKIEISTLSFNPFDKLGKEWFLLTSGDTSSYNTMTAAWGMFGYMWNKPIVNAVVRPQRYTYEFMEKNDLFTISFYDKDLKDKLTICGTKSGRDIDKAKECGFTAIDFDGSVAFDAANLVMVCKKIYTQDMTADCFIDSDIDKSVYPTHDYHKCYVGEIIGVYAKD